MVTTEKKKTNDVFKKIYFLSSLLAVSGTGKEYNGQPSHLRNAGRAGAR